MRNKLEVLKRIVEERVGFDLTLNTRKREYTYGRAVFCKLAREIKLGGIQTPYSKIGEVINKDHATVMHNIKNVFPFAIKEEKYNRVYQELTFCVDEDFSEDQVKIHANGIKKLYDEIYKQHEKISELMYINSTLKKFNQFTDGLSPEELDQLYEKVNLTVKVIKSQRDCYA